MMLIIYLLIGLFYWIINSFIRKLDIDGDWLLPLVWFLFWPVTAIAWLIIAVKCIIEYLESKLAKNQI